MSDYYLAVDIGASSGRHILGHVENGHMILEEIYRFDNGLVKRDGNLCWDIDTLFEEIKNGLKQCNVLGKIPVSMGIDTWAVDFVLLDKENCILGNTVGYRDKRTKGMDEKVYELISVEKLYERTGIQKLIFNTIYQLMSVKVHTPELLEQAETFLMIPDYLHYLLTGKQLSEYTNATSTQLVSPETHQWDYELIELLGLSQEMFRPLSMPGTRVGNLTEEIAKETGFTCEVILPATHDTASAVLAVPSNEEDFLYISSGTWSLMGTERKMANCSMKSMKKNFTNEGGYKYRFRFLKNIMGLWMIQSVRHELQDEFSFARLCAMAEEDSEFPSRVDVNDECFLAPDSMIEAIKLYCQNTKQEIPSAPSELAACIYQSLAENYADTAADIEDLTGKTYDKIHIVGGGSNAEYLNKLTAKASGKQVFAGPSEATAIGNLTAQMIQAGVFQSVTEARACIYSSFDVKEIV